MDDTAIVDAIGRALPSARIEPARSVDMPTFYVTGDALVDVCRVLRDDPALQFSLLVEVTAADYWPAEPRFEVVYHLACIGAAFRVADLPPAPPRRLRLKVRLSGADAQVPSVTSVWPGAGWPEREVFDLFGISFEGHPDLRRILMPEDWTGFPLRRDSAVQIRKDTESASPLQLSPEEFAANIRAQRRQAKQASERR